LSAANVPVPKKSVSRPADPGPTNATEYPRRFNACWSIFTDALTDPGDTNAIGIYAEKGIVYKDAKPFMV
jgi:hypothetical protein